MQNLSEDKFFNALKSIFIGVPVEGESGFVNLISIKSRYFDKVIEPGLRETIDAELQSFPDFREELFDRIRDFFRCYFNESGSIGFFSKSCDHSMYEKVSTSGQDVMLFWETARLYYVKTDRLFRSTTIEVDGFRFHFDVSQLQHKHANEKRKLTYVFKGIDQDGNIVFTVQYSEKEQHTKADDICRDIHKVLDLGRYKDNVPTEKTLQKAFRIFERQQVEADYFLCKDARSFLLEQFDLWLWQYLMGRPGEDTKLDWTEARLAQLRVLKRIAYHVIDYIAVFEDEVVRIWNKPKFVSNSHYVVTLDRIAAQPGGMEMLARLFEHPNMDAQLQEWRELGMVDEKFQKDHIWTHNIVDGKHLHHRYRYLPIDTKHFPDLELPIVALFDNLDEALDGWLIKSENYQALNTILPKFRGRVQTIYIDPPYNSASAKIDYLNRFKHSSWIAMIDNRLLISKSVLSIDGIICVAIDDNEFSHIRHILSMHFPEELGIVVVRSNPAGRSTPKGFSINHEYALFFAKDSPITVGRLPRTEGQLGWYKEQDDAGFFKWVNFRKHGGLREESPRMYYPVYVSPDTLCWRLPKMEWDSARREWIICEEASEGEVMLWPVDEHGQARRWKWSPERLLEENNAVKVGIDRRDKLAIYIKSRMSLGVTPPTWWDKAEYSATDYGTKSLKDLFGHYGLFTYPKAVKLVEDCIRVGSGADNDALILDFFAGSGTTAHAVINLNREDGGRRKYILVEMADYFYTVLLPRIKKVVFSDKWKDGNAQPDGKGISHFVKYYELEQFEDTLRRTRYAGNEIFNAPTNDDPCQYIFLRDPKMLEALDVNMEENTVQVNLSNLYENVDLPETLSNLTGKWIKRIELDPNDSRVPAAVVFADDERVDLRSLDWRRIKPLIWW